VGSFAIQIESEILIPQNFTNMDFWGPPKDVCVNRGLCYDAKTEKSQSYSTLTMHIGNTTPVIIIIIIITP